MEFLRNRKVLVTGGCGFIGSHLVEHLLRVPVAQVRVIDDLSAGREDTVPLGDPRLDLQRRDLGRLSRAELDRFLEGTDYVFHLAAVKHREAKQHPRRLLRTNVDGTYALLEAAADAGVKTVVFSSSVTAYGRMTDPPMRESDPPVPRTLYGISKLSGEHLCEYVAATRGLPITALRIFFAYGPKQHPGLGYRSVILQNFRRLLAHQPPVIHGDGRQVLDYVYIDDTVRALCDAAARPQAYRLFNVAAGAGSSILELTRAMQQTAGTDYPATFTPPDETDGTARVADLDRIRSGLGWEPRVSLADGLTRTYRWLAEEER